MFVSFSPSISKRNATRSDHFVVQVANINNDEIEVSLLGLNSSGIYYFWATQLKKWCIEWGDLHLKFSSPSVNRRLHLLFPKDDLEEMTNCCNS